MAVIDPPADVDGDGDLERSATVTRHDFHGNLTHEGRVEDVDQVSFPNVAQTGSNSTDLPDAGTLSETTTRYDARHRRIASTTWLVPLGPVDPDAVPIAGGGQSGDPAVTVGGEVQGLTTTYAYDDDLTDGQDLEVAYATQVSARLGGGFFTTGSDGSAVAMTNPEGETTVRFADGAGRTVLSVDPTGDASSTDFDTLAGLPSFGQVVETVHTDPLGHGTASQTDGAGRTLATIDAEGHSTTYAYDANSNLVSFRDPNGVGEDCGYDLRDRKELCYDTEEGPENARVYGYDANSNLVTSIDASGTPDTCVYDARDRKTVCTDRVGAVTTYAYDPNSNLLSILDGEGGLTSYAYDPRNLQTLTVYPNDGEQPGGEDAVGGDRVAMAYDGLRRPSSKLDQAGTVTALAYDLAGRMIERSYATGDGGDQLTYLESGGEVVMEAEAPSAIFRDDTKPHFFEEVADGSGTSGGKHFRVSPNIGTKTKLTPYLRADYKIRFQTPGTYLVWLRMRASNGNDASVYVGLNGSFEPAQENRYGFTDYQRDNLWRWTPNSPSPVRITVNQPGEEQTVSVFMREDGAQFDKIVARISTDVVSGLGPAASATEGGGGGTAAPADTDTFTYDLASRLLEARKGRYGNRVGFTWTDDGLIASETLTLEPGTPGNDTAADRSFTTKRSYDADDQLTRIDYPNGAETIVQTYTDRNQLRGVVSYGSQSYVADFSYDPGMRETSRELGNELTRTSSYGRADNLVTAHAVTGSPGADVGPKPELSFTYAYADPNKNLTAESRGGVMAPASFTTGHDTGDRLTAWDRQSGETRAWNLSLVGDWAGYSGDVPQPNGAVESFEQIRSHNPVHELLDINSDVTVPGLAGGAVTHDPKGNITGESTAGQLRTYAFDADNMLTTASVVGGGAEVGGYAYDALGRRVSKTVGGTTTVFVSMTHGSGMGQVIQEYEDASSTPARSFIYGIYVDEPLAQLTGYTLWYYHRDRQFNVVGLTNGGGTIQELYRYTPYGSQTILVPDGVTVRTASSFHAGQSPGHQGLHHDAESGLIYNRARYRHTELGRWMGRDPSRYLDSASLYLLYIGSPLLWLDQNGEEVNLQSHAVFGGRNHTSVRIVPENQGRYRDPSGNPRPPFREQADGTLATTLGSGPVDGRNVSERKRDRDWNSPNLPGHQSCELDAPLGPRWQADQRR